jgi:hypothetical protein
MNKQPKECPTVLPKNHDEKSKNQERLFTDLRVLPVSRVHRDPAVAQQSLIAPIIRWFRLPRQLYSPSALLKCDGRLTSAWFVMVAVPRVPRFERPFTHHDDRPGTPSIESGTLSFLFGTTQESRYGGILPRTGFTVADGYKHISQASRGDFGA